MQDKPTVQVIGFGHDISPATRQYVLDNYGEFTFHKVFFHMDKPGDIERAAEGVLHSMIKQGVNMDPAFPGTTLWVAPGMTSAGMMLQAGWFGATGKYPSIIHTVKNDKSGFYEPCVDKPILDVTLFKNRIGRQIRARYFQGSELVTK